jgi:hypothetical protein
MTTPTQPKTRIPAPLYAAAGAADLAYQKLRDLQAKVVEQGARTTAREFDVEKLRAAARRNASAFVAATQAAQEKAFAVYTDLVARGEKVVKGSAKAAEHKAGEIADTAATDAKPVKRARAVASDSTK